MAYFDVTDPAHLALIRKDYRDGEDLKAIAEQVEADVIRAYSGQVFVSYATLVDDSMLPYRYVYLRGFTLDPNNCRTDLANALRATIANALTWRMAQLKKNPLLDIQFANGTSLNYKSNADDRFPKGWRWYLKEYDVRPDDGVVWSV